MEKKLVAGYDIQKNKVQLSFYIEDREDAESVSPLASQIDYEIPCLVAKTEQGWVVGEEALTADNSRVLTWSDSSGCSNSQILYWH